MSFITSFLSCLYLLIFAASGILLIHWLFPSERPLHRLWLGCVIGLVQLLWLPTIFSFILGFTLLSQILALFASIAIGVVSYFKSKGTIKTRLTFHEIKSILPILIPLLVIGIYLFSSHTIIEKDGALYVGQSTYGDLAMHLGFITSIAEQHTFPPMYSICPDTPVGYPFLSDSISATFYLLGSSLRFATLLPAVYAYILVLLGVYLLFEQWLKDKVIARFATLLFFLGGGFGFAYFADILQLNPNNFSRIFSAFYETPTNNVSVGIKWVNPIADMLVPQRATLFGWALLFPCLHLLLRCSAEKEAKFFPLLGCVAASMPLVHTHSFLALGVISAVYFVRALIQREETKQILGYFMYAGIVALLAGPQLILFTFRQSASFLQYNWNWANTTDSTLWFYVKNLGLLFILLPISLLDTNKRNRSILLGPAVLWLLAETIQFQPNPYDNNKLLFVCFAFLCGLIAEYLINTYRRLCEVGAKSIWSTRTLAVTTCVALFSSGVLTLGREIVSEYQLFSADEVVAAEFIRENTDADSVFATHNNHNNTVASLSGRNIVCGSGSFLFYHGVEYSDREQSLRLIYEEPTVHLDALSDIYDIDYVYIGNHERYNYDCDYSYYLENYSCIYRNDSVMIFDLNQAP